MRKLLENTHDAASINLYSAENVKGSYRAIRSDDFRMGYVSGLHTVLLKIVAKMSFN